MAKGRPRIGDLKGEVCSVHVVDHGCIVLWIFTDQQNPSCWLRDPTQSNKLQWSSDLWLCHCCNLNIFFSSSWQAVFGSSGCCPFTICAELCRWTEKKAYTTIGRNWRGVRERTSEIKSWICSFCKKHSELICHATQKLFKSTRPRLSVRYFAKKKRHFLFCSFCALPAISKVGDLGALVTAPYRFVRLASITKAIWTALGWSMRWAWLNAKL